MACLKSPRTVSLHGHYGFCLFLNRVGMTVMLSVASFIFISDLQPMVCHPVLTISLILWFQTEYPRFENGRFMYRIHRSPMCEYMINFIHKLKHLPEKYMMNSVLENFTILQVCELFCTSLCVCMCSHEHACLHYCTWPLCSLAKWVCTDQCRSGREAIWPTVAKTLLLELSQTLFEMRFHEHWWWPVLKFSLLLLVGLPWPDIKVRTALYSLHCCSSPLNKLDSVIYTFTLYL